MGNLCVGNDSQTFTRESLVQNSNAPHNKDEHSRRFIGRRGDGAQERLRSPRFNMANIDRQKLAFEREFSDGNGAFPGGGKHGGAN